SFGKKENMVLDLAKYNICLSFVKDLTAKGMGLRVADSHTGNHCEDDFLPLETIRRLLGTDIAIITKKRPKPNKNEHEIVKSTQKPDPKTFLYTKAQNSSQAQNHKSPIKVNTKLQGLILPISKDDYSRFKCKLEITTPGTYLAIFKS
nr:hypothetical protein [Tanacetum cinerariifolium]